MELKLEQGDYVPDGTGGFESSMSGSTARLRVRLFEGELRFFYSGSPKDYYYLPEEDIAVHKSIASAVDKEHRVQRFYKR